LLTQAAMHSALIRRIFEPRDLLGTSSNFTCAKPIPNQHGDPLFGGVTFRNLMLYITAPCLGITTCSALFLIWKHLHRYTKPEEQRQNVRIIFMPVVFGIISLLSILFYEDSIYFKPLNEVYQAFCIAAIFLLYVEYVCPDVAQRPEFFSNVENKDKKGNTIPGGSLLWFNVSRFSWYYNL
jgi:hypothetical protein